MASSLRHLQAASSASQDPAKEETRLLENDVPQRASVTSATFLVETPSTYRDPLHVHFHECQYQGLLVALVAGKKSRAEGPFAVLRNQ